MYVRNHCVLIAALALGLLALAPGRSDAQGLNWQGYSRSMNQPYAQSSWGYDSANDRYARSLWVANPSTGAYSRTLFGYDPATDLRTQDQTFYDPSFNQYTFSQQAYQPLTNTYQAATSSVPARPPIIVRGNPRNPIVIYNAPGPEVIIQGRLR